MTAQIPLRKSRRLYVFIGILLLLVVIENIQISHAQFSNELASQQYQPAESLFRDDTCSAPCWFGLIPGESTEDDVIAFLESNINISFWGTETIVDYTNAEPIGTSFVFFWEYTIFPVQIGNRLNVRSGILAEIDVFINENVHFTDMINIYDNPDYVRFGFFGQYRYNTMHAIYLDRRLRVEFRVPRWGECNLPDSNIEHVHYLSDNSIYDIEIDELSSAPPQPQLLFRFSTEVELSMDMFDQLLRDSGARSCEEFGRILSRDIDPEMQPYTTLDDGSRRYDIIPSTPRQSLFAGDICSAPCWFGLVPGQSTSNDILTFLNENRDILNGAILLDDGTYIELPDEPILDGNYSTGWRRVIDVPNLFTQLIIPIPYTDHYWNRRNRLQVTNGILQSITVTLNDDINLGQTLDLIGEPENVWISREVYFVKLHLFYPDQQTIIILTAVNSNCSINTILDDFGVEDVTFYAEGEPANYIDRSSAFSTFTGVYSNDLWQSWLSGANSELTCNETLR